jgi:CheY-like chemotaxis protein
MEMAVSSLSGDHSSEPAVPAVLVVEDVVLVRMLLAEFLRASGFEVMEASDGEEAIRIIERLPVRIVISDLHMPGAHVDGLGLARWIHGHRPDLKVILVSGVFSTLDPADAALHDGPLLQKPFKPQDLARRLRSLLDEAGLGP